LPIVNGTRLSRTTRHDDSPDTDMAFLVGNAQVTRSIGSVRRGNDHWE
jgi:hypothetical protein